MNRQEILNDLANRKIWFQVTEHKAVYHMDELSRVDIPYPQANAKNLFVRDDKKRNFYLITVKGDKRVDLKKFRKANQTRPLSFGSESELMEILGLTAGSVTPFGVLNDEEKRVKLFLDRDFFESPGLIGVHPNDNRATDWLRTEDLLNIIREHGNEAEVVSV